MKILHLTSVHGPFDVRIFHKECKSLANSGHDVTLIAPHHKDEVVGGIGIRAVRRRNQRILRITQTVLDVLKNAVKMRADVYHFHDPELLVVGFVLSLLGRRVIYDAHEDVPKDILDKSYLPAILRRPVAWSARQVEEFVCRYLAAVIAVTPNISGRLGRFNANTLVVYNFPFRNEFAPLPHMQLTDRPNFVAHVGYVTGQRGIGEMVEAMGLLPSALQARLVLAGGFDSGFPGIRSKPGWQRVDALGFSDRSQIAAVLRKVRAGLLVYHPIPNHLQALPTKMYEYMAAGIPVIASDFPLWRKIVTEVGCGLLVDPLDPRSIAQAIEFLLTHPAESDAMGHRGRNAVESLFNWEIEEKKLYQLYSKLTESQPKEQ